MDSGSSNEKCFAFHVNSRAAGAQRSEVAGEKRGGGEEPVTVSGTATGERPVGDRQPELLHDY